MSHAAKIAVSNGLMALGLLPHVFVIALIEGPSGYRGDPVLAKMFVPLLGFALAWAVSMLIALPGFLWSRSLARSSNIDTPWAGRLRTGVVVVLAVLPGLALILFIALVALS